MVPFAHRANRASDIAKKAAWLLSIFVLLAVTPRLFSQAAVGTILGGVFDSSGGAIAGAKVTITDQDRGTSRQLTTDSSGQYTAPELLVGNYKVRAEAAGFQALEQTNIVLEVAESARIDLKLSPGATTQTVTITSEVPSVNTTDATLGGTVTNTSVSQLPLESRNFLQLLQLRPGVVDTPGGNGTATVTNGRREGADVILVEGVTQFDLGTSNVLINGAQKGGAVDELPLDSVQEFSTQQDPPAEYGWRDGSAVNLAVKSGTNSIHGTAYAFGRDAAATDANHFTALPQAESNGNLTVVQPGFTVGGPLVKDKLFWFVSGEFIRQSQFSTTGVVVPADLTMVGSASVTGTGCGSAQFKTTTPGNCAVDMIDACNDLLKQGDTINPLSAQLAGLSATTCTVSQATSTFENLFPYDPTNSDLILPNPVTSSPSNNGLAKVDYSPSVKHHFDGFYYISRETQVAGSNYQPYWSTLGVGNTNEYAGAWTYTPNSNWVNDLRGGAAPNSGNSVATDTGVNPASPYTGIGTGYGVNTGASGYGFMCVEISGVFPTNSGLGNCGKNGIRGPQYQMDFTDKVSWLHGNHAFKWGYEQVFVKFDDSSTASQNGIVNFSSLESFLTGGTTGTAPTGSIITGNNTDEWREQWHAAFVQDTWRITPRVTITPGLRWEYIGAPHSIINKMGNFDPNQPGGAIQVGPGLTDTSGACVAQNVSCESQVTIAQKTDFNPRGGVAWDIFGNGRTVLRAGAGMMSSFPTINATAGNQIPYGDTLCNVSAGTGAAGNPCPAANIVLNRYGTTNNGIIPNTFSVAPSWTNCAIEPTPAGCANSVPLWSGNSLISSTTGPTCGTSLKTPSAASPNLLVQCSMLVTNPNLKNPRSAQWNLDIQHAINNNLTFDVAYVGVHGWNEIHSIDLNEPALGSGWDLSALSLAPVTGANPKPGCLGPSLNQVFGPTSAVFTSACTADAGGSVAGATATGEQASRPYNLAFPYFSYIAQTTNGFRSNYDGLQVTFDGRNYHGFNFLFAYTFSHALDDWTKSSQATSALANPANPQYQYGNSDMDVRNRLRFSPSYIIPGTKKVPGQMLEGWQVSAIWAWQTGFAWAPNDATSDDWGGTGENADRTIPNPNSGVWQSWNYSGPKSAFSNAGDTPIPCYGGASGCTPWATVTTSTLPTYSPGIWATCSAAAVAPYGNATENVGGTTVTLAELALAALTSSKGACYIQKGGILTPPAYGTLGNAGRGLFTGPRYQNVDLVLAKNWKIKERYSAQLRIECYNIFNHVSYSQFGDGSSDPSSGGGVISGGGTFGFTTTAQAPGNRQFQFGLKLGF